MIGDQDLNPTPSGLSNPDSTPQNELRSDAEPFGPVIFSYSRKQALADGLQVDVSQMAAEAGFRWPVFLTRTVYDAYVAVPEGVEGQDKDGRLWDILNMLFVAVRCSEAGQRRISFRLYVRNDNRRPKRVELQAVSGALDIEDPSPAITVMQPGEE